MASTYSSNLGIELIGSGEQSGTWGTTTNNNLGTLLEQSICGYGTAAVTTGNTTTITMPNGASGTARNMVISVTGTGGASTVLAVPDSRTKIYTIFNGATGAITVRTVSGSGISVPTSTKAILYCDGTNVVDAVNYFSSLTLGAALPVASGGTGLATLTANNVILGNGVASPTFVAPTTNGNILTANGTTWVSSAPATNGTVTSVAMSVPTFLSVAGSPVTTSGTLAVTLSGTALPVANGGTGVTSTTAYAVYTGNSAGTGFAGIANGTTGQVFTATTSGAPSWAAPATNGTVTSVAAITLGTTGTDLSSTVATGTTTPVITLQVPTASASNRGALSAADWTTFNNKQPAGSYLTSGGALGTPSSGTVTNLTGTASININGTVGATTENTGAFTTVTASTSAIVGSATTSFAAGTLKVWNTSTTNILAQKSGNNSIAPWVFLLKSRGTTPSAHAIVSNGDGTGILGFYGDDGATSLSTAFISSFVDGVPSTNVMPGNLIFATNGGSSSSTERMRITSAGLVGINCTPSGTYQLEINGAVGVTGALTVSGAINGTATNVSGTVAVANGGTGATTASGARTSLGLSGTILQIVNSQTGAVSTGTTVIPQDDTIPQITEGDQYMSLAITPTSATSKLKIDIVVNGSINTANSFVVAMFQDSTVSALAAINNNVAANNLANNCSLSYYMVSGTTSATTFSVRCGSVTAATFTFNGQASGRLFGGAMASSITITEIAA